ncbi:MAG: hypothetical protein WBM09_08260 [Gallionella sp.]
MKTYRIKAQGTGRKVQEPGNFPCVLPFGFVQRGFSLISAIFLLVIIAALGTFAVTVSTSQQQDAAADVMGVRAYQAARAGLEWAAYGVAQTPAGSPTAAATLWSGCATGATFAAGTLGGTLAPFKVVVTCTSSPYTEGSNPSPTIYIYTITSVATGVNGANPGDANYVERDISLKMGR